MNIYPSTQVRPYVYFGIHKVTKEIYLGYREANTKSSHIDIFEYRTSSKVVNPFFDEYDWYILAEFFNGNDAYDFEQQLIFENWNNPLLLNVNCRYGSKSRFKSKKGCGKGKIPWNKGLTKDTDNRIREPKNKGVIGVVTVSGKTKALQSKALKGKPKSAESSIKKSIALKGRPNPRKGIPSGKKGITHELLTCLHCGKTGGRSNMVRYHFDNCKMAKKDE